MGCDGRYGKLEAGVGIFSGLETNRSNFILCSKAWQNQELSLRGEIGPCWGEATWPLGAMRREQGSERWQNGRRWQQALRADLFGGS